MSEEGDRHVDPVVQEEEVDAGEDPFSQPPAPAAEKREEEREESDAASDHEIAPQQAVATSSSAGPAPGKKSHFAFKVCDPRMTLPSKAIDLAYWIYTVVTKCDLSTWDQECQQARRYSDFVWLRDELMADFPGAIVPPLPEKNIKGQIEKIMLNDVDLLTFRQRALTRFLTAVGEHPHVQTSPHLENFCKLEHAEWEAYKASTKKEHNEQGPGTMANAVQKGKEGWFKMFKKKGAAEQAHAMSAERAELDKKLEDRKTYAKDMEDALGNAHDKLNRHIENRAETGKAMAELAVFLDSTGELESSADPVLGGDMKHSGTYTEGLSKLHGEQAAKERYLVLEVLGYYIGMYCAIKEEVRRIQRMQITLYTLADELEHSETALRKAGGDKKVKAEANRDQASTRHADAKKKFEAACALFDKEWDRFHANKQHDMKVVQKVFVELQISFSKQQEALVHQPIQPAVFNSE